MICHIRSGKTVPLSPDLPVLGVNDRDEGPAEDVGGDNLTEGVVHLPVLHLHLHYNHITSLKKLENIFKKMIQHSYIVINIVCFLLYVCFTKVQYCS